MPRFFPLLRICPLILSALLLLSSTVLADVIVFKSGGRLEGKVIEVTETTVIVHLDEEGNNRVILPRHLIERIEYDYGSRLEALASDDYVGHYELGLWCVEGARADASLKTHALQRFLYVLGREGIPPEVWLQIARLYESIDPPLPQEALKAYRAYLAHDPNHPEAKAAARRLVETIGDENPAPPPTEPGGSDGLEVGKWSRETWGNPGTSSIATDTSNGENKVLVLRWTGRGKDKTAFKMRIEKNLSSAKAIVFDVFNPENAPVKVAVAVVTGDFKWYESRPQTAPAETWRLGMRFDLSQEKWKSEDSKWRHSVKPDQLDRTRAILILIFNGSDKGAIYMDAIQLQK